MFFFPKRIKQYTGRFSLVDGIPFKLPVSAINSPALMAIFPINLEKAKQFLPKTGIHPFRLWNQGLLIVTVIDYRELRSKQCVDGFREKDIVFEEGQY